MQSLNHTKASESELFRAYNALFVDWQYLDMTGFGKNVPAVTMYTKADAMCSEFGLVRDRLRAAEKRYSDHDRRIKALRVKARRSLQSRIASWHPGRWRYEGLDRDKIFDIADRNIRFGKLMSKFNGSNTEELMPLLRDACDSDTWFLDGVRRLVYSNVRFAPLGAYFCRCCGRIMTTQHDMIVVEGRSFCPRCVENETRMSEVQGTRILIDHAYRYVNSMEDYINGHYTWASIAAAYDMGFIVAETTGLGSCMVTPEVYQRLADGGYIRGYSGPIGAYHSSKTIVKNFITGEASLPYLGMELEMECKAGVDRVGKAKALLDAIGTFQTADKKYRYCATERDGSLSSGFEVVTAPCTLDIHHKHLTKLAGVIEGMVSHNTTTCGLHVHVDKKGTSRLHRGKMVYFINSKANEALVRAVARRYKTDSGYAKIKDKMLLDGANEYHGDRYEAVNLTNRNTIEFRIFKGTLRYESIMACLEFTHAVWHFTREAGFGELTTHRFLEWVDQPNNRQGTSNLRQILFEKKMLTCKRPPLREASTAPAGEE